MIKYEVIYTNSEAVIELTIIGIDNGKKKSVSCTTI